LLIQHSKYSAKYTPIDCFFGDFAHWELILWFIILNLLQNYRCLPQRDIIITCVMANKK